uniref:hypothetical protein n=1 Tax=Thiolapillus sp. TaxID=2017437 RepID=UPI0025DA1426
MGSPLLKLLRVVQPETGGPARVTGRKIYILPTRYRLVFGVKRVFGLVIDFGTSQSPKSTRPLTTYWCPSRPGHPALRNN